MSGSRPRRSLAVALSGGTAPYVGTWFEQAGRPGAFPRYVAGLCAVSRAVCAALPETARKGLER